ncbi:Flp family type IVb pilin [Aquibacillus salsiterrae]|uniref:Flp family type IVb pilin n=1 Tax=Aquibacillus salsiterrae TaxID=2950439 RepID=A0A9X3WEF9_9BACI|nr:Flp family type IVb pilin [Aquibacillus salsiterrae]MDC3416946.1 Flp family type IVb pilin [Aquibacillus salsiterrae]
MVNKLKALFIEEEGQGMTEYALVLGVIAVGVVAILLTLGDTIIAKFQSVVDKLQNPSGV